MIKYKALYKLMMDDLTDAEMLIHYACEIRKADSADENLAKTFKDEAEERLEHFMKFHKVFEDQVAQEKTDNTTKVSDCLWDVSHEYYQSYYNKIKNKIESF